VWQAVTCVWCVVCRLRCTRAQATMKQWVRSERAENTPRGEARREVQEEGSCLDDATVVLVAAVMAWMIRPKPTALHSMVSGTSSSPTGPQPRGRPRPAHRHRLHRHKLRAAWAMRESAGVTAAGSSCDRGVDVAPAGRGGDVEGEVAVVPDRSQPRLPAPGEQHASRQQNRRGGAFARADGERKLSRAEAGAPLGGHVVGAGAGTDGARARVHLQHVHKSRAQRQGRPKAARAQRQGRPKAARAAGVAAGWAAHTCGLMSLGLEEVGDKVDRGVDRLARALVPRRVHGDVCAWVLCVRR